MQTKIRKIRENWQHPKVLPDANIKFSSISSAVQFFDRLASFYRASDLVETVGNMRFPILIQPDRRKLSKIALRAGVKPFVYWVVLSTDNVTRFGETYSVSSIKILQHRGSVSDVAEIRRSIKNSEHLHRGWL